MSDVNQETAAAPAELPRPARNFRLLLSPTPRGARLARLLSTEQLRSWGLLSDAATHVIAELAANAATHGRMPGRNFQLTLNVVGDTPRVEVTDTRSERLPKAQHPGTEEESGRGLLIVAALADRWGVSSDAVPRKTVWAELTVPVGD
ncbi:ATP-binding protein [Streptomyces sp. NPDC091383]|uniref:ATP-binding protein n=1 Tax=Streptomyces sp. NPDC091383 TaxID=3365996 RepID=UPI003808CD46